jgi:glycosyltransferase involved in cell wall biosynthesis
MPHGFNKDMFYPIPRKIARKFVGIDEDAFVIVNLNRNQPRKRWDICIMAYIKFICKHMDDNIKLMIATNTTGGWDIFDIMISECRKYDITFQDLKKHLIILQNPQQITDKEINIMYNVGDIGINTCDGEGFGLCNFEQAGVGIPQIVPKIGGFVDYLDASRSILINPKWTYYCDHSRDFVSGEAEVCDINDIVNALEYYYTNKKVRNEHGNFSREYILQNYKWQDIGKVLYDVIQDFTHDVKISESSDISITSITETEDIDIDALINAYNKDDNKDDDIADSTIINEKTSKDTFGNIDALINAYNKDDNIVDSTIINEKTSKDTINADSDDDSDDELIIIEGGG